VADALASLQPGDVIVTASTNPSWNAVLPLAGALVVEEGGALSHAAIIARELALPAVIGARGATTALVDGDLVVVDAAAGTVVAQGMSAAWARAQR
jgi:pyruvate,water dikinase